LLLLALQVVVNRLDAILLSLTAVALLRGLENSLASPVAVRSMAGKHVSGDVSIVVTSTKINGAFRTIRRT